MIGQLIAFIASYKLLGTRITAPPTIDSGFAFKVVAIYSAPFEDSNPGILTINISTGTEDKPVLITASVGQYSFIFRAQKKPDGLVARIFQYFTGGALCPP